MNQEEVREELQENRQSMNQIAKTGRRSGRIKRLLTLLAVSAAVLVVVLFAGYTKMLNFAERTTKNSSEMIEQQVTAAQNMAQGDTTIIEADIVEKKHTDIVGNEVKEEQAEESGLDLPEGILAQDIEGLMVEKPVDYSIKNAIAILTERSKEDARYTNILENQAIYPEKLLINLANNPELISFVSGYPGDTTVKNVISEEELEEECPFFLQWDKRWGYMPYGDNSNIAISGCGPTALSMVVVGLTKNEKATPSAIADYAMNNGYYMYGTGTMWKLMTEGAAHYGVRSEQIDTDQLLMDQCLKDGGMLICSVGPGDFTPVGHFIVIYGGDGEGYTIRDPFCIYRSNQTWTFQQIKKQIKSVWTLY